MPVNVYSGLGNKRAAGARGSSGESSGGVGQEMQAAAPGTDVREMESARARPDQEAQPANARPQDAGRLGSCLLYTSDAADE